MAKMFTGDFVKASNSSQLYKFMLVLQRTADCGEKMLASLVFAILAIAFLIFTIAVFAVLFMAAARQTKRANDFSLQLMTALCL